MTRAGLLAIGAFLASVVGCQLIVPADVPSYVCGANVSGACPDGLACDERSGRCVQSAVDTPDAELDADADVAADSPDAKVDAGPFPLGETCQVGRDCASQLCGTSTILTTAIVASGSLPICTKTCCTSVDCPDGFVCFGPGTGGNYCVAAEKARRPASLKTASKAAGDLCAANAECRSGLCQTTAGAAGGMRCVDTCCNPSDCAAGTTCRVTSVSTPAPAHDVWACAPSPTGSTKTIAEQCSAQDDCKNDDCIGVATGRTCRPTCCSAASCAAQSFPGAQCGYSPSGVDQLKVCGLTTGASALGVSCTESVTCQSAFCDPETQKCAQVCCEDRNCPSSEVCRPSATSTPFLRCVPGSQ